MVTTLDSKWVMQCDQTAIRLLCERRKRALDFRIFFHRKWDYIDFEIFRSRPYCLKKQSRVRMPHAVEEESNVLSGRRKLPQNLYPFGTHRKFEKSKSSSVSSRMRQTRNESLPDRIAYVHEYGRDVFPAGRSASRLSECDPRIRRRAGTEERGRGRRRLG